MSTGVASVERRRALRPSSEAVVLVAFILWSLLSLALLFVRVSDGAVELAGGKFTGSDGLAFSDHMQYLAWIRDSGEHLLISSRFDVADEPHLFLHPMALISGVLWKAGVPLQLSLLLWKPAVVAAIFGGYAAYVRRMLGRDRVAAVAALVLAVFLSSPAVGLLDWLDLGDAGLRLATYITGFEPFAAFYTWGAFGAGLAIGLVPVVLLGVERVLDPARRTKARSARWYAWWTGAAGLVVTWMHPWQGLILLAILGGLVAWGRFDRRYGPLAVPALLTAAPLAYYFFLSHTDSAWGHVSQSVPQPHLGWWLVLGLGPALLIAAPGMLGRAPDTQGRLLRLWPVAAFVVYFALDRSFFYHAFAGLGLPLAVLAVLGFQRLRPPLVLAVAILVLFTIPGVAYTIDTLRRYAPAHFLSAGEGRALDQLEQASRPGAVLAPRDLGQTVPAFTGRDTWVGHYTWTPDFDRRKRLAVSLFDGKLAPRRARAVVRESGAAFLLSDCRSKARLDRALGRLLADTRRFGCARLYEIRTPSR